jgi:transposase-like protein
MLSSSQSDRVAFWRKLIAQRQSSRLSVRQVCERAGVSPASFFQWQRRLRTVGPESPANVTPALVPVCIVEDRIAEITIELSQSVRVRLAHDCDEATLQRVLRVALAACREQASC